MNSPQTTVENSLVSAAQAARDPLYREALWASAALASMIVCAAFLEWLKSGSATVLGELLVLLETVAIYARTALSSYLTRRDDILMEFLTGVLLAPLAGLAVLNSLALFTAPEDLNSVILVRLFSLAAAIEFLSILLLLQERWTITTLIDVSQPRFFAWVAHCALLSAGLFSVLAPVVPIDGLLGLCIAVMSFLSATDYIKGAISRLEVE